MDRTEYWKWRLIPVLSLWLLRHQYEVLRTGYTPFFLLCILGRVVGGEGDWLELSLEG